MTSDSGFAGPADDVGARPARVTRADVARHAGVSTATVSYTLNNTPGKVSAETRHRVLAAAVELGYQPNAAARALKLGSTSQLGLVVPGVINRFFADLTDRLEAEAADRGLATLITSSRDGLAAPLHRLVARQVDGVIIASEAFEADLASMAEGIPVVLINPTSEVAGFSGVGVDRYQGARLAVEHLLEHGHRRIAFIGPDDAASQRHRAWADALKEADAPPGPVISSRFSREHGYQAGKRLVQGVERPTAAFVASDEQAVGVLLALHETGVAVPQEIAVASFDGSQESAYCWPPLTTAAQPLAEIARIAVDSLITLGPRHITLPAQLQVRTSCGCPPATD